MSAQQLKGWKVLVVDDDPKSLDIASILIKHHGAELYTAVNGQEALDSAREHLPDFILTDISMPVMDGWELIRELKLDRHTTDIPIIALTAHAMVGDRDRAIAAGCHNYLTKPLRPISFVQELVALLADVPKFQVNSGLS